MPHPLESEEVLRRNVVRMAENIPLDIPSADLGRELIGTLDDGRRSTDLQLKMVAAALAAALKMIRRSNLNTPTEKESK